MSTPKPSGETGVARARDREWSSGLDVPWMVQSGVVPPFSADLLIASIVRLLRALTPRAAAAVLAVAVLAGSGCGGSAADDRLASGPFRLVEHEDVYLNGVENDDRPPISFLLVGSDSSAAPVSEAELLAAYVEAMREDGWRVDPYDTDRDWWGFYGGRGAESVRIGPASEFAALATADEGYSRPKFRRVISELDEPLVVVSIDPQD